MSNKMLEYILKESAIGIRMMMRDSNPGHVFDLGTDPEGKEYVFVMTIVEKSKFESVCPVPMKPSRPLNVDVVEDVLPS